MAVTIEKVQSRASLRRFIYFPEQLYSEDPLWSPPIWMEERRTFSDRNPVLGHSDYRLFLARSGGRVLGRILAYADHSYNRYYNTRIGMFGSFETAPRPEVAEALFAEGERWLASLGMQAVRGPINPVAECWGLLCEGFSRPAAFMMPYNPLYYNEYLGHLGYRKVKDLLAFEADAKQGYRIPGRFIDFREKLLEQRPELRVRRLDMARLSRDARAIWRVSNEAIRNNWGWVPYDREELESAIRKIKPIADPDAVWIVEDAGRPVGFCLGFPDINSILRQIRGRLLPLGFVTLMRRRKRLQDFRIFGLAVLPDYHSLGLDVLLYMSLFEALAPRGVRLEASYVLEDNAGMVNALKKLGLAHTKTYRVYEKELQ
jgi:GNAT superfamily N-acetyltransferase